MYLAVSLAGSVSTVANVNLDNFVIPVTWIHSLVINGTLMGDTTQVTRLPKVDFLKRSQPPC